MFESDRASIYLSKNFGEFSLVKGVINKSFFYGYILTLSKRAIYKIPYFWLAMHLVYLYNL